MSSPTISLRKLCQIASRRTASSCRGFLKLCNQCSSIRVRFDQGIPVSDELIFLGPLKRIKDRQNCPLCRLVIESLPSSDITTENAEVQCMLNPRHDCGETFALYFGNSASPVLKAWIRIECPPGIVDMFSSSLSPVQNLDSHSLDKMVERTLTIDTGKIRSWLQECEKHHGVECDGHELNLKAKTTHDMLLIDVVEEKLVDGNQDSRYIALSYVWGSWGGSKVSLGSWKAHDFLRTKGAFQSSRLRLPNALRDAMDLTRSIGERYLWCDAICVFQESVAQKAQQIAQMDIIYSQALLTIIALTGQHGDQPLLGIRRGSRKPVVLSSEAGGGIRFIARAPSVAVLAAGSTYKSRAWTFQEKLLSRCCLFMTNYQVFFQCAVKCYREDEDILDYPSQRTERFKLYSQSSGLAAMMKTSDLFGLYSSLVHDYTSRNLTNPWDILNAFEGISKVLERHTGSSFIKGLPRSHFHDALLWTADSSIQKRSGPATTSETSAWMPSWSWVGFTGQICYKWPNSGYLIGGKETLYELLPFVSEFLFIDFDIENPPNRSDENRGLEYDFLPSFQGLKTSHNSESQYRGNGREAHSSGFRHFLIHFVHYGFSFLRYLEEQLFEWIPKLRPSNISDDETPMTLWDHEEARIKDFLNSYAPILATSPFPHAPSLEEFKFALQKYKACDRSTTSGRNATAMDINFWPFYYSNDGQQGRSTFVSSPTTNEIQESVHDKSTMWPFPYAPSLSTIRSGLQGATIHLPSPGRLCFWAHVLSFDLGRLRGGQLFRNSFSASSYFTTRDGKTQCNVTTLDFTTDPGVSRGHEIQPATVLWNAALEPCGIVLENEDACVSRIAGRRCYLILLSQCLLNGKEMWYNYMIAAETIDCETLERISIARILCDKLTVIDTSRTLRYIQLE